MSEKDSIFHEFPIKLNFVSKNFGASRRTFSHIRRSSPLRRDFPLFSVPDPKFSRAYGAIFRYLVYQIQNFRAPTACIPLFSVPESKICARLRRDFRLYTVHKSKMFARAYGRLDIHNVV